MKPCKGKQSLIDGGGLYQKEPLASGQDEQTDCSLSPCYSCLKKRKRGEKNKMKAGAVELKALYFTRGGDPIEHATIPDMSCRKTGSLPGYVCVYRPEMPADKRAVL